MSIPMTSTTTLPVVELTELDSESMPLCPCCGQPVYAYEGLIIGCVKTPFGSLVALIHEDCAE